MHVVEEVMPGITRPRIGGWMNGMEVEALELVQQILFLYFILLLNSVQHTDPMFCLTPLFNHV